MQEEQGGKTGREREAEGGHAGEQKARRQSET